ncbi:MAG TPA: bifunctional methylenetetrahydrofolate dehydrogenase/methenyltetrahydrofolate cyclohydrolase FolD [Stellaceae bacterium]|jgi:methylenetetrahydrofolate dehydrogenase (NADP+)/methenyltetrahydrofolate cyclohydrolase|nr:bifunctional methylenetetrahydrofolate dehydrogenase/methenyltetrahydrofolate cyclohydrolase FolD [Stellaceae bacterium]
MPAAEGARAEAALIDGKAAAAALRQRVAEAAAVLKSGHGIVPGLAAVLVGDDPASQVYVRSKERACAAAGLASFEHRLPANAAPDAVLDLVRRLDADDQIDGILVQLPLPRQIDPQAVIAAIDPAKDVDGFHPVNIGRLWGSEPGLVPCTPQGCLILLRQVRESLAGAEAVVIGRSPIVGRPVAALLLAADCTITMAHSKSRDLAAICRRADILIAAAGRPGLVKGDWIKPGATVIDVGITRVNTVGASGLIGDVDFAAARKVAGAITPVPGGVGPMTIACMLRNTVLAACRRRGLADPEGLRL